MLFVGASLKVPLKSTEFTYLISTNSELTGYMMVMLLLNCSVSFNHLFWQLRASGFAMGP